MGKRTVSSSAAFACLFWTFNNEFDGKKSRTHARNESVVTVLSVYNISTQSKPYFSTTLGVKLHLCRS